jgi:hypothetical protein
MTPKELLLALFETLTEHLKLPEGYEWAPLAGTCLIAGFGLVLLVRGAAWAPGLAALTFLGIGGWVGSFLASAIGSPFWPTTGVIGMLGFVLGLVMFRFWQAILLAACFVVAGLSVYFVRALHVEVANWHSASAIPGVVTLPPAGTVVGDGQPTSMAELSSLWSHLNDKVPNFATTFWALVSSTALAGLVFGLLLPRAARALWAASLGTALGGIGCTALLTQFAPGALAWLTADNARAWGIVGLVWVLSLAWNLATCRRRKSANAAPPAKPRTGSKPAMA